MTLQGEVLRLLRRRAGWTQARLAEEAGYPRERISAWESPNARHGIHDDNARVLAKALGADANALTKTRVQETLAHEVRRLADEQERRLEALEARVDHVALKTAEGFVALGHLQHGLGTQRDPETG